MKRRAPLIPYALAAAGFLGGAWLIALWAFGLALMVVSVTVALLWDDGQPPARAARPGRGRTFEQVMSDYERAA